MIIYNVTINIDDEVHQEWVNWMKKTHIPDVLKTGKFREAKMMKILSTHPEESGHTYAIQYFCPDMETLNRYFKEDAPRLQKEHSDRYQNKFTAFRTIMQEV
jgi:hypothetical protein